MTKPTVTCCATPDAYCSRIDTLVDLDGVHVVAVVRSGAEVTLTIETPRERQGCRRCGVVALSHGRRTRLLRDVPCAGSAVLLRWRQRTWACPDDACPAGTFTEEFTRQSSSPRGSRDDTADADREKGTTHPQSDMRDTRSSAQSDR